MSWTNTGHATDIVANGTGLAASQRFGPVLFQTRSPPSKMTGDTRNLAHSGAAVIEGRGWLRPRRGRVGALFERTTEDTPVPI